MHDGRDDHPDMRETIRGNGSPGRDAVRNGRPRLTAPPDDELDALAELFLGPEHDERPPEAGNESPARAASMPAGRAPLEGLVIGHLPVLAGAWPTQYARERSEQLGGPVALVRLASGTLTIELVGWTGGAEAESASWREAAARAVNAASLVLVRVDEPDEAELVSLPLGSLRLLSGADDAAIVACYRKLKGIAVAAEREGAGPPRVALAVMGASRERALAAHERIARAARAFLEAELPEPLVVERVGPTRSVLLFRGGAEVSLAELVGGLREAETTMPAMSAAEAPAPLPASLIGRHLRQPEPAAPIAGEPEIAARATSDDDRLSTLAGGLAALESRCPLAERVELAVDGDGRLHLVAGLLSGHTALSSRRALRDLLGCAAWATQNRALLERAEPAIRAGGGAPSLHLVTDRPGVARALLGTAVRVHLAAPARARALGLVAISLDA